MPMDAATYNNIRRIIFSTAHDPQRGFAVARHWLESSYRKQLGPLGFSGLMAELNFYERHRKEYFLTVAGDMGEHADFAGLYRGSAARFDVTTNLAFKRFKDYEPYVGEGVGYQIALLDEKNFEIIDVFDLAFQRCRCGGHLIPFITVFKNAPDCFDSAYPMNVCSACKSVVELDSHGMQTRIRAKEFFEREGNAGADNTDEIYDAYSVEHYKLARAQFDENLMGIALPHGSSGSYWGVQFTFLNQAIQFDTAEIMPIDDWIRDMTHPDEQWLDP